MNSRKIIRYMNLQVLLNVITPIGFLVAGSLLNVPLYLILGLIAGVIAHELGHFLSMKYYKYKSLAMYLLLPLGGFVIGKKENQKVSEALIVILAGPVPGIIISAVLIIAGRIILIEDLEMVGIILLVTNIYNLLPIYPLDGGLFIACLCKIRNQYLLFFLLLTLLPHLFLIIFYRLFYLAIVPAIQVFLVVLIIRGNNVLDEYEYDLSVWKALGFGLVYIFAIVVPLGLLIADVSQ